MFWALLNSKQPIYFFLLSFYSKIVEKLVSEVYCAFSDLFFTLKFALRNVRQKSIRYFDSLFVKLIPNHKCVKFIVVFLNLAMLSKVIPKPKSEIIVDGF